VLRVLLEAVDTNAVYADESDYKQFRSAIRDIRERFSDDTPADELLIVAGAVSATLKEYGDRVTRYLQNQNSEYKFIVSMLTGTVMTAAQRSGRSMTELLQIESQLDKASALEDVREIRLNLRHCLQSVQQEIRQQEKDAANLAAELQQVLEKSAAAAGRTGLPGETTDSFAALPGRTEAQAALMEAAHSGRPFFAVVVVALRMATINARFGFPAGDRILQSLFEQFRKSLERDDRVFRWRGPSFVLLIERAAPLVEIRQTIARISSVPLSEEIDIGNRSVLLPVSSSWSVFPLVSASENVSQKIDDFVVFHAIDQR
jgi:GGDEF domain-containing protein